MSYFRKVEDVVIICIDCGKIEGYHRVVNDTEICCPKCERKDIKIEVISKPYTINK